MRPRTISLAARTVRESRFRIPRHRQLHNLSDADFTYSIPAVGETQIILQTLAPRYGYDPINLSVYNNVFDMSRTAIIPQSFVEKNKSSSALRRRRGDKLRESSEKQDASRPEVSTKA